MHGFVTSGFGNLACSLQFLLNVDHVTRLRPANLQPELWKFWDHLTYLAGSWCSFSSRGWLFVSLPTLLSGKLWRFPIPSVVCICGTWNSWGFWTTLLTLTILGSYASPCNECLYIWCFSCCGMWMYFLSTCQKQWQGAWKLVHHKSHISCLVIHLVLVSCSYSDSISSILL